MLISENVTNSSLTRRGRILRLAFVCIATVCVSSAKGADSGTRRHSPPVQQRWSAAQVDADASAVTGQPPLLVSRSNSRRQSVASASKPAPLRQQAAGQIRQVGFLEDYGAQSAHGGVCDCVECSQLGPTCGMEAGYLTEPSCGLEFHDGFEASCGLEPACGLESFGGGACGCNACSTGHGSCDGFGVHPYCEPARFPMFLPILSVDWNRFEFFYGTQAFLNPMNVPSTGAGTKANSGSFGFHEGFNEGRDLQRLFGADLSAQLGLRATQSNLEGQSFTNQKRNQIFITGGLFRTVDYGLQYGAVLDYLNDDWYYHADLLQLRGELSWKFSPRHNLGFHWMAGLNDEAVPTIVTNPAGAAVNGARTVQASDQYRAFYRYNFGPTGQWTSYVGGTDNNHVLFGSDMDVPLTGGLSMKVGSTYFAPTGDSTVPKYQSEGWNVGISMVYRPGCRTPSSRYVRPMFNVADNGSFFVF